MGLGAVGVGPAPWTNPPLPGPKAFAMAGFTKNCGPGPGPPPPPAPGTGACAIEDGLKTKNRRRVSQTSHGRGREQAAPLLNLRLPNGGSVGLGFYRYQHIAGHRSPGIQASTSSKTVHITFGTMLRTHAVSRSQRCITNIITGR